MYRQTPVRSLHTSKALLKLLLKRWQVMKIHGSIRNFYKNCDIIHYDSYWDLRFFAQKYHPKTSLTFPLSYSTIVLYSRDHAGVGVACDRISP